MPELVEETERLTDDDVVTPEERQQAVRLIVRFVAAGLAVILAAGVALLVTRDNNDYDFGGDVTLVNSIGPLSGRDVPQYIFNRKRDLSKARDVRAAVVSLNAYATEADARRLVEGLNVRALLVAAPGGAPAVVTGDLATWADTARQDATSERKAFEEMLPTYDPKEDAQFLDEAKAEIARLQRLEKAVSPGGDVVFAVVVVAPASELRRIAGTTGVRLVDVGEGPAVPAAKLTRGIRPEEVSTTGDPLTRPV